MRHLRRNTWIVLLLLSLCGGGYWIVQHFHGAPPRESDHWRAAQKALEERDFHTASVHLEKHLNDRPDDLPAWLLAAQTARRDEDYLQARKHRESYAAKGGRQELVVLERQLVGVQRGDLTDAPSLLAYCRDNVSAPESPLIAEALIAGNLRLLNPNLPEESPVKRDKSAPDLEAALWAADYWLQNRQGPADRFQGLHWRAQLLLAAEQHKRAMADLRQAVELNPDNFQVRLLLAQHLSPVSPKEAAVHLDILHRQAPSDVFVHFKLANTLRILGQDRKAKQLFEELIAADPRYFPALVELGNLALDAQDANEAMRWLRRAEPLAPNNLELLVSMNRCLILRGDFPEAQRYMDRFQSLAAEMRQNAAALKQKNKSVDEK
jgi:tetratricopeptide (TPR) repeat protein